MTALLRFQKYDAIIIELKWAEKSSTFETYNLNMVGHYRSTAVIFSMLIATAYGCKLFITFS